MPIDIVRMLQITIRWMLKKRGKPEKHAVEQTSNSACIVKPLHTEERVQRVAMHFETGLQKAHS